MCDGRKLLLAAIVFYFKVNAETTKLLDMAPNAVDYTYDECRTKAMEKFIHSDILKKELNNSKLFTEAWGKTCAKQNSRITKEHTAALLAYADGDQAFTDAFDRAVETLGVNVSVYEDRFHFKSLHFLLMDSMFQLRPKTCKTLYALKENEYKAQKGSEVRFGKFVKVHSTLSELEKWEDWDGQLLLTITSCFFVNLGENICGKDQSMTLISPAEVFTVEAVDTKIDKNQAEYTEIVLKHSQLGNEDICSSLSGSRANVASRWIMMMLVALSLLIFSF